MSIRLTILGSGSPEPCTRRASSGYLLEVGEDVILFDCGGGVFDNLVRSGRRPSDITHIIFSHLHSDHMMDYARLVHSAWDEGGSPIHVYGPAPIADITAKFFGPDGVFAHDLRARTELGASQQVWVERGGDLPRPWPAPVVYEVEPGFDLKGEGWTISSCAVPHAQPMLDCMALRLDGGGRSFVFSGDAALCDELEVLAKDADLLIHWCYRLDGEDVHPALVPLTPTPAEIAQMATRAGVDRLSLTHFRVHMDSETSHAQALQNASAFFGGPVTICEDLEVISV